MSDSGDREEAESAKRRRFANRRIKNDKKPRIEFDEDMVNHLVYKRDGFTPADAQALYSQLGYLPYNVMDVAARNDDGQPIVARLYGLTREKTCISHESTKPLKHFPTIYWLTCPKLKSDISKLEDAGWITRLQDRLNGEDTTFLAEMRRAHESYAAERRCNLRPEDLAFMETSKAFDNYHTLGIAGMRSNNFNSVKCLHTHYAHYMGNPSHGNCIGRWVAELLETEL